VLNWIGPDPPSVGESSVVFSAWLPPFHRYAVVWKRADLTAELEAARLASETRR